MTATMSASVTTAIDRHMNVRYQATYKAQYSGASGQVLVYGNRHSRFLVEIAGSRWTVYSFCENGGQL